MAIFLDTLRLPDNLAWSDELDWSAVRAAMRRTIAGRGVLTVGRIPDQHLRPVTLASPAAWMSRADLLTLQVWAQDSPAERRMVLSLHDGRALDVIFRHWEQPVLNAETVLPNAAGPGGADLYQLLELRLAVA